jgi:hypothetical protein
VLVVTLAVLAAMAASSASAQAAERRPLVCAGRQVMTLRLPGAEVRIHRAGDRKCAVVVALGRGRRGRMSVSVQARGSAPFAEERRDTRRAGPVGVSAPHRCVRVTAVVDGRAAHSGWILC